MNIEDIKKIIPGFTMGMVRAVISHPFEMMKLKSQINQKQDFFKNLFKGMHYSVITNALERGIQFGLYEKFKLNDNNINSSAKASVISTTLSLPYNIILLRNVVMKLPVKIPRQVFIKSAGLEYSRNLSGSIIFLSSYNYLKENDYPIYIRAPLASSSVWLLTYPVDTYKNMLLSNSASVIDIRRLYRGIQYPLMRSIPSSIAGFYVYEYMMKIVSEL
jgi:hypothetical protein